MRTVGIRELKRRTSEIVRTLRENGEEVRVTYRGEIVARLVALRLPPRTTRASRRVWTDLDRLAAEIGARWSRGVSAARAVSEGRRG
jgi:antitoxin (DNA-binding transcriptional repressor) of toxin-antitoxin stability system